MRTSLHASRTRSRSAPHEGQVLASAGAVRGQRRQSAARTCACISLPVHNAPGRADTGRSHSPLMTACACAAGAQELLSVVRAAAAERVSLQRSRPLTRSHDTSCSGSAGSAAACFFLPSPFFALGASLLLFGAARGARLLLWLHALLAAAQYGADGMRAWGAMYATVDPVTARL